MDKENSNWSANVNIHYIVAYHVFVSQTETVFMEMKYGDAYKNSIFTWGASNKPEDSFSNDFYRLAEDTSEYQKNE